VEEGTGDTDRRSTIGADVPRMGAPRPRIARLALGAARDVLAPMLELVRTLPAQPDRVPTAHAAHGVRPQHLGERVRAQVRLARLLGLACAEGALDASVQNRLTSTTRSTT
jgi:hypothetical protein